MQKDELEFVKGMLEIKDGSVREACIIVREFLKNTNLRKRGIQSKVLYEVNSTSAVSMEEFLEAATVLLNYSFTNSDKNTMPETFYCRDDCRMKDCFGFCKGEFTESEDSKQLCKYYTGPKCNI